MRKALLGITSIALLVLACGSGSTTEAVADTGAGAGAGNAGVSKGEQIFRLNCTLCHGRDGKLGFNGAKDLTASTLTRADMIARVSNGKGTMQPYKNVLTAKEIEAVVDHIRSLPKAK